MKCPKPGCGWTTKTNVKFCQECGSQMVPSSTELVVICGGNLEDGSPCHAEIVANQKFCKYCGKPVDQQLFKCQTETCAKCGSVLEPGCVFCDECGLKKEKKQTTDPTESATQSVEHGKNKEQGDPLNSSNQPEKQTISLPSDHTNSVVMETSVEANKLEEKPDTGSNDDPKIGSMNVDQDKTKPPITEHNVLNNKTEHSDVPVTVESIIGPFQIGEHEYIQYDKTALKNAERENENLGCVSLPNTSQPEIPMDAELKDDKIEIENHGNSSITLEYSNSLTLSQQLEIVSIEAKGARNMNTIDESEKSNLNTGKDEQIPEEQDSVDSDTDSNDFESISSKETDNNAGSEYQKKRRKQTAKKKKKKHKKDEKPKSSEIQEHVIDTNSKQADGKEVRDLESEKALEGKAKSNDETKESDETIPANSFVESTQETTLEPQKSVFGSAKDWVSSKDQGNIPTATRCTLFETTSNSGSVSVKDDTFDPQSENEMAKSVKNQRNETAAESLPGVSDTNKDNEDSMEESDDSDGNKEDGNNKNNADGTNVDTKKPSRRQKKNKNRGNQNTLKTSNSTKKESKKKDDKADKSSKNESGKKTGISDSEKQIRVVFHVLLSEDFKFDPDQHKLTIRFERSDLGGWENEKHVCKLKRRHKNNVVEMSYEILLPTRLMTGGSKVVYKYCVYKPEKGEHKKPYYWENYISNKKTGADANRTMTILPKWKSLEVWHQYDGFAEKEPSGRVAALFDYFTWRKELIKHVKLSIQIFCPDILLADSTDDIFDQLEILVGCLKKVYYIDSKCWESREKEFKEFVGNCLVTTMMESFKHEESVSKGIETTEQKGKRVAWALAIVYIMKSFTIEIDQAENRQLLCRSLLLRPVQGKQECFELEIALKQFPRKRKQLLDAFVALGKSIAGKTKDPCWLFIMPWIHFLSESCKPYDTSYSEEGHDKSIPTWWGIAAINDEVAYFKAKSDKWSIPMGDVLNELFPLFEMDHLLPRTFMTAIELKDLNNVITSGRIPMEVYLATAIYHLRSTRPRLQRDYYTGYRYYGYMTTDENKLLECLKSLAEQIEKKSVSKDDQHSQWEVIYRLASTLLEESLQTNRGNIMQTCAQILVHGLGIYDRLTANEKNSKQKHHLVLNVATSEIVKWLDIWYNKWDLYLNDIMEGWNTVIAPASLPSENIRDMWNKVLIDVLALRLQGQVCWTSLMMTNFVQLYCQKLDHYKPCMQECLSKVAFQAISNGWTVDYGCFTNLQNERFGRLLSNLFITDWKKQDNTDEDSVLNHVVGWAPFQQFLRIYYKDQKKLNLLSKECVHFLVQGVSALQSRVCSLLDGSITVGNLNLIGKKESKFPELAELVQLDKMHTVAFISKAIEARKKEIAAFDIQAEYMSTLTALCQHLPSVDRKAVDKVLGKQSDIDKHQVREFCHPAKVEFIQDIQSFQPKLGAFQVSEAVLQMLPQLHTCYRSNTFMKLWRNRCNMIQNQCSELDQVVQQAWIPVQARWHNLVKDIKNGVIKFQDMENLIGRDYKEEYDAMGKEFRTLNLDGKCIKTRIEQLKKYRKLNACVKGANVILSFANQYKLKGDFEQIRVIAGHGQTDFEMRSFDNSLMKTCGFLESLTAVRARCLEVFVKCGPLVDWLKESMKKSGLKELKVFVDLAFMSAGDEPMNIRRVQCLHSAVTGYAPLIFDLQQSSGYRELLELCNIVWRELDADAKLPQKLKDTNHQLLWLKEIKKAHGSVEVTSLVQAEAINSNGIYTIGISAKSQKIDALVLGMSNILKLTVREEEGRRQLRNYTYSQLQDLQSRLMLVAGKAEKGNDGVERFTMIFDSTIRLSNVYKKLHSAGCILFKDWTARFLCDPVRPVCAILEFGQGDDVPTMKGRRTKTEGLREFIPQLANFMENCLAGWLEYIRDKRKKYLHLNYFTVDQLVILQRELVKLGTDREEEPSHHIYPLLSAVKQDCTPDDLLEAMSTAKAALESDVEMEEVSDTDDGDEVVNAKEEGEDVRKAIFIQELVTAGYSESLAIKALEHNTPDEVTEGIIWCMSHCDDDDEDSMEDEGHAIPDISNMTSGQDVERPRPVFSGWSQSERSIQSVITSNISGLTGTKSDVGVEPLIRNLTTLWSKFLGSITSNIQDYLSLEHLGLILRYLAQKNASCVNRSLPAGLEEGAPNLIVCPSGDVLSTALSLYMLEKDQPLPQSDEVLMCTTNTTIDEVDIFWRRAIFNGGEKIHCLVNADLLDFEVSEAAERCLEQYMQETNYQDLTYRLVVLCGSDNEYRSRIVASLDKHRRPALPTNTHHLREYLATKLRIKKQFEGVKHAANVDFNRSSVRLIKSWRSGVGKSLYKKRREADLARLNHGRTRSDNVSIPLQEKHIDLHSVISRLLEHTEHPGQSVPHIFHLDVAHEVQFGVDYLLFNLLVLGCLMDKTGYVWRKSPSDLYLIETMPLMIQTTNQRSEELQYVHQMLSLLPDLTCRSPQESLNIYSGQIPPCKVLSTHYKESDQLFDAEQFQNPIFQRPFQYLSRLDRSQNLDNINPHNIEGSQQLCLLSLLRHCGMQDPSWAELHHFVWFLNTQLCAFEQNSFVSVAAAEDLPGFSKFVLQFLIQMSRDFSTRSLNVSEESPGVKYEPAERIEEDKGGEEEEGELERYQMRRTWESSPHPYLFFNSDNFTFTFLGFNIDRGTGNLIDEQTGRVLDTGIMAKNLYDSLVRNHAPINENFDSLPRDQKILKLCMVMGIDMTHDPDDSYELTTDNVKKILAIFMRFRCDIPVIIMGETGCGKTRLIKFMCALQAPPGVNVKNMILMKVHGGTTNADIKRKVREAEKVAHKNVQQYGQNMFTVLFFDEANTTESIGLIKEIMCDKSMEGTKLTLCENLKMVAACNPYRKHSDELIKKLEQAGLGYHVDADETTDKLGRVPMRRLVYRVQPLPQSLLPLVWDFGQLNYQVEDLYIRQMVRRYIRDDNLPNFDGLVEVVSAILTASQNYMREQKDECSFVSLRDVDRVLSVMSWFYIQSQGDRTLYNKMDGKLNDDAESSEESEPEDEDEMEDEEYIRQKGHQELDDITRSLVLALGVCYHACLKTRPQYRHRIARFFQQPCQLPGGADQIEREIMCCQDVFLDNVQLEKNIARNMALKENLFMMVVCIELRIPLFLVGKPGSSKSLAKTIVSDAMQGNAAREELFKELKQAQMVSFQCSPLSTPDGIMGTFRQCAQFQKDKDLNSFVSIVVLDEVGLAEDSPRMPLKTLHPLLEDGCQGDEKPEKYMKVAFIGISNWALDPAKMNRGILVQREVPDQEELQNSARGICFSKEDRLQSHMELLIEPMAESYLETFEKASSNMREFFGLRDFYSLVKMIYSFVEKSRRAPTWHQMLHAIKRNFGGLDKVDPVDSFRKFMSTKVHLEENPRDGDPDCTAAGLIQACLFDTNDTQSESRYLLLLTENYGALTILEQQILDRHTDIRPIIIFGSSFRSDQEYTQVCRNINKIKVCMETGNTVVLLNLENLYESLYDALNQYYVYFGGERYVDLGLGTHRVKCPVHKDFRLIVVAEKQTVYKKFPIPLINRLEKHFLTINTMLSQEQQKVVERLEIWAKQFSEVKQNHHTYRRDKKSSNKVGDVFMGYHDDTCSAIVLHVWGKIAKASENLDQVVHEAKVTLLWCATPDAVARLEKSNLPHKEQRDLIRIYNQDQKHDSIVQYLQYKIILERCEQLFAQVTTHSKLLAGYHKIEVSKATGIALDSIMLLDTLSSFDTEQQFSNKIQQHLQRADENPSLLMIQCDSGDINANLVACARYCVMDEYQNVYEKLQAPVHIVFIVQLPRIAGGCFTGFQCGKWHSVHIDDLWSNDVDMPSILDMQNKSVAKLIGDAVETQTVPMETDENMAENPISNHDDENMDWVESSVNRSGAQMSTDASRLQQVPCAEEIPIQSTSAAGYQLENVIGEFESIGGRVGTSERDVRTGYHGKKLNVKNLILSCVQAALSMVKDKDENSVRTTERVPLILKLFHNKTDNGSQPFLEGVSLLIAFLLKEKEANTQSYGASHWLVEEAAKFENIHKAGTFKRSCIQTLESKISPILAAIIAYLDRNQNLSILQDDKLPWKQDLWLSILKTQGALNLKYSDLQSPARHSELHEAVVMTTGCEGHVFQSRLPFSWLIHDQITEILKAQELMEQDEEEELCQKIVRLLSETAIGKLFQRVQDYAIVEEVAQEYIDDFVHVMFHAHSDQEHALVIQSISYVTQQMVVKLEETSLLHMLVCVHMSYQSLAPRLAYFRTMNQVWPDCSLKIVELKQTMPDHFMFKEEEFTFSALCLLIENLTPVADQLNNPVGKSRWLNKVHQYRPVVEKVLRLHAEDPNIYGAHGHQSVRRARGLWSRVVAMKLFLEHVCAAGSKDKITIKHCMPLWKLLGEEANLKEVKSMNAVEAFLKSCNKTAMKEYMGKEEKCCNCEVVLDGPPIVLPCKDLVCDQCYHDLQALGDSICPKCRKSVSQNWNPARQVEKKQDTENLKEYQKCCNTFFMDVVSQLCFADNSPPSDEVIGKLLGYITCTTRRGKGRQVTKELTIFDSGIDPNPVFRSFLLQLLMRTSEHKVKENLEKYLIQAQGLLIQDGSNNKQYVELCQLIIQCLEDIFLQNANKPDVDEVEYARKCLQHASYVIFNDDNETVETLYGLAESRLGLAITARYISETVLQEEGRPMVDRGVRKLIEAAQNLCLDRDLEWPRIFLVKYMCRCYGIDAYQAACKSQVAFLRWIGMPNMNRDEVVEGSDRYVVCGDRYNTIRETLTKVILGEDIQQLAEQLQGMHTAGGHVEMLFQLALHREITCSNLYPEQQRNVSAEALDKLGNLINNSDIVKDKNLLQALVRNELGDNCGHLTVTEGIDLRHQGLQCLLVHFLCVMSQLQGERTLMQPLIMLVRTPQACANAFLPTMPQDDLADVKEALLAARRGGNENPVFYRCPNGHPYVIGDCGRPYVVGKCKCGADIGGQGHQLLPSNTQDAGLDATVTGHILGRAEVRGQGPITQRSLTPAYCAWVRLITHMSMYMGAARNIQGIHAIIKPDLMPEQVPDFLWRHMLMDINDLQRVLGKSVDDILLLGHSINSKILNAHRAAANEVCCLSTKNGRHIWEQQFSANYIQPILRDMDGTLKKNNQLLLQDQRLGSDPLLCLLYETDTQEERENPTMMQQIPAVWRYRTPISIEHLRQEFEAQSAGTQRGKKQHQVLKQFLKEDHYLRAIRYIPSILRLHRALFHKYQRKLDKAEASTITVGQLKKEEILGAETVVVIQDFVDAWELVREELRLYLCPTEVGGMIVAKDFCNTRIQDKTPISMLLPTTKEVGLCSFALLDFLMRKQNDFLDKYLKMSGRKADSVSTIPAREVTSAHLISYDPQNDILPLVLANCQYSFEIGKGTKIEYDFTSLERQLMDRFLFSKSRIDVGRVLQIDLMVYRSEFTNAAVFKKLADKIPQESLSLAVKSQICSEIRSLPDLCLSLDNLDITISFLKSIGGDKQNSLNEFMINTLKMESSLQSQKAGQVCEFQHTQSLWMVLSFQKSKQMAEHSQPRESIFESVIEEFHEDLPEETEEILNTYMRNLSIDKLTQLLEVLHEYILLKVAVRENPDDEDYTEMRDNKMRDWLYVYIEGGDQFIQELLPILADFPEDILHKHSVHTWIIMYAMLREKQTGNRRS